MTERPSQRTLTRRDFLELGVAGGAAAALASPPPAVAQTPKRGGVLRLAHQQDPIGFDPHQTISYATMIPLSFAYSRLVKVKAGPSVTPGTYPVEPDLAESWSQPDERTWLFKLRRGVRWHPKPPVNGRELTADDVKYNSAGVNDGRLVEMITLQRRTADPARRRDILWDIQRHVAHHAYYLYDVSQKVVSAWEPYVRNYAPNNGFDYGGRLMAVWLDR
jgi:ABC-type transport system substrate-binding protein